MNETLPEGWNWTTLGAVADFVNGDRSQNYPSQSDRVAEGVPFINTGHIEPNGRLTSTEMDYITRESFERLRDGKVRPGDIVYCLRGATIGKTARNHFPEGAIASSLVIVRAKAHVSQEYLYFYLISPLGKQLVAQHDNGSAQPNLSVQSLRTYPLALPPIDQQHAIARILGTIDDKIELNRKMSATLEMMARALFRSWFVDFDPVRAKPKRHAAAPEHIDQLFPGSLVDSELGEVPSGFPVVPIGDLVELIREQEDPSASPDAVFYHFSLPAFDEGQAPRLEVGSSIKSNKWRVPTDAVLLSKLNPEIERVWLPSVGPGNRAVCSTEFLVLRAKSAVTRSFLYCLLRSPLFRTQIEGLVTGTSKSHQRAQVDSILNLPVVKPPAKIAEAFDRQAASLLGRAQVCRAEVEALGVLRNALLPKLLSGEVLSTQVSETAEVVS